MKSKFWSQLFVVLFICLPLACQESYEEVKFSTDGSTIEGQSTLAQLVSYSSLNDGSFDNILDNASSISIKLPVSVIANNVEIHIESTADFDKIIEVYNEEPFVKDSIRLNYPVTAILADYSERILNSATDLEALVTQSIEGGSDLDIECFDYVFPLQISLYDKLNQVADVATVTSDKDLFQLFDRLGSDDLASFTYPLQLITNGSEVNVENNLALSSLLNQSIDECDEGDEPFYRDEDFRTARLTLELTDAPFPFDLVAEANVKIDRIEARMKGDADEDTLIILSEEEFDINLLELTNGLTESLVDMQIPVGSYDQFRLRVTESNVVLTDDRIFDLTIPSGQTSGIKVNLSSPIDIEEDSENEILLDFDVSRSFVVQGNPDTPAGIQGFIFKPVIKAVDLSESGTLTGEVTDVNSALFLQGVQISIYAADTLNTTTFSDENGAYTVLGLIPGAYVAQAEYEGYQASENINVTIIVGEESTIDFALLPD